MRLLLNELLRNINLVLVLTGFVALESGVTLQWSGPVAAIVGGVVLIVTGSWPYVSALKRKP